MAYTAFSSFKYHGIYVEAYINEKQEVKKSCIQPTKDLYQHKKHYFRKISYRKGLDTKMPNGIQVDTTGISSIDIDKPSKCVILDKLLEDCKFTVKTRKGYHFYFKKEDILPRVKQVGIADINMDKLWYVPVYTNRDNFESYHYTLQQRSADAELVDMPEYAIQWCQTLLAMCPEEEKKTKPKKKTNKEEIVINPDIHIEKFNLEVMDTIYNILYSANYFNTYTDWANVAYIGRHCNNTYDCFELFDKYSRKVSGYENNDINVNMKCFYGKDEYDMNFDENGILLKCRKLNSKLFNKTLASLIKSKHTTIKFNRQYIYDENSDIFDDWNDNYKCIAIKSAYGTGKTYAFKQVLSKYKHKRVIFITYRQSLATSFSQDLQEKFGFESYLDKPDIHKYDRVIIQLDSIRKLFNEDNLVNINPKPFDLVVLDETEGLLNHLSFNKIEQHQCYSYLENIVVNSNKVLALDGDMSDRSYDFLTNLDFDYKLYENEYKTTSKNFEFSYDIDRFRDLIETDLENGKKIVIVSMSKEESEYYNNKYNSTYNVIIHNSLEQNKSILKDVNKNWSKCDLLIYSPSVESGVDFNIPDYFYKCYTIISNTSTSYRALFQMLNRVRHYESNEISVLVPKTLQWVINELEYRFDEIRLGKWKNVELNNLTRILIHNNCEELNTRHHFLTCMIKTLLNKGHTYTFLEDKKCKKSIKEDTKSDRLDCILNCRDITNIDFEYLLGLQRQNKEVCREDKYAILKFMYKKIFKIDVLDKDTLQKIYNKQDIVKNYRILTNTYECEVKETEYFKKFTQKQVMIIRKMVDIMGLSLEEDSNEVMLNTVKDKLLEYIDKKDIKQLFLVENWKFNKYTVKGLNKMLEGFGYVIRDKRTNTKNTEGKWTLDYRLILEKTDAIKLYDANIEMWYDMMNTNNMVLEDEDNGFYEKEL